MSTYRIDTGSVADWFPDARTERPCLTCGGLGIVLLDNADITEPRSKPCPDCAVPL